MAKTEPFDTYSDAYDQWFEENRDLYEAELEAIRQVMPEAGGQGVEVGVGTGRFAAPLGVRLGVEPSREMAAKAEKHGIDVSAGIAEALPFPNGRFDFVLMVTTICFVDDRDASFREAFRVLKPGGCIIVGFVDKDSDLGRRYEQKRAKSAFYSQAQFVSAQEVLARLQQAGFQIAEIRQTLIPGEPSEKVLDGFGLGGFIVVKAVAEA